MIKMGYSISKKNILFVIVFLILAILICIDLIKKKKINSDLRNNGTFVSGKILSFDNAGKSLIQVNFLVIDNKDTFRYSNFHQGLLGRFESFLTGKSFPVIRKSNDKGTNRILITPKDFAELSLSYPDSLKWVLPYIKISHK